MNQMRESNFYYASVIIYKAFCFPCLYFLGELITDFILRDALLNWRSLWTTLAKAVWRSAHHCVLAHCTLFNMQVFLCGGG